MIKLQAGDKVVVTDTCMWEELHGRHCVVKGTIGISTRVMIDGRELGFARRSLRLVEECIKLDWRLS